jgi:membrane-bound serine protease (ClpP class)
MAMNAIKFLTGIALLVVLLSTSALAATVKVMTIDGPIGAITLKHFERALQDAEESGAQALVVKLNTPGGVMETTLRITTAIMNSRVPVIVWIAPSGGRAASAGVYITYAAHVAAMASSTNIGSATPVAMGGEMDSAMVKKVVNDAIANLLGSAEKRRRNKTWIEQAVRQGASLPYYEAIDSNVVDFLAEDFDELLAKADGRVVALPDGSDTLHVAGATREDVEKTFSEKILEVLTNPNIIFILFSLGSLGLAIELYNPGSIFPGVVGAICIIVALFAMQTLPINYAGLALIILAIVLFLLEIKVTSYGMLTVGGIISLFLGGLMLIDSPEPALQVSLSVIITITLCIAAFLVFVVGYVVKSYRKQVTTGYEGMIGQIGKVAEAIDREGMIYIAGALWKAVADEPIEKGAQVRVVSGEHQILKVAKLSAPKEG